jgi:hypothetical protein
LGDGVFHHLADVVDGRHGHWGPKGISPIMI